MNEAEMEICCAHAKPYAVDAPGEASEFKLKRR
jgi:hypothetical protein